MAGEKHDVQPSDRLDKKTYHAEAVEGERLAVETETFAISEDALGYHLPKNYYRDWHFIGVVFACAFANNSQILPYVLSANSIPAILADIGPSQSAVWINLVYTLCVSVSMLISGRLADIFGRRWFVIGASLLNCLGCIIAATARSVDTIVGGTVLIGLGSAVQLNFPMVISELVPNKHRSLWIGSIYSTSIVPYGFGAVIARELALLSTGGWRWCYYLGIIVAGLAAVLFFVCYTPPNFHMLHMNRSKMEQLKRQDKIGILLFTGGLVVFLLGISWGGALYPWSSARVIVTTVVGGVTMILFALYEIFMSNGDQILPTHLFKAPGFASMVILASVGTTVAYSGMVFWPQQVNALLPGSPTKQGLLSSVLGCTNLVGFATGGILFRYLPWHRTVLAGSALLLVAMCGAMASVEPGDFGKAPTFITFIYLSIGWIELGARSLLPLSCPDEDLGAALGALGSIGYATAAIGTAVYSATYTSKITSIVIPAVAGAALEAGLPDESIPSLLANFAIDITAVPGINADIITAVQQSAAQGYADAFRFVWYCALAFAICAFGASLFTANYTVYFTDKVARKLQYSQPVNMHTEREQSEP